METYSIIFYMYLFKGGCTCHGNCGSWFSFYCMGSGDQPQVIRFGTKNAYKMSHLIIPVETFKSRSCLSHCYMEVKLRGGGC